MGRLSQIQPLQIALGMKLAPVHEARLAVDVAPSAFAVAFCSVEFVEAEAHVAAHVRILDV